jgi:hypothetical protein
LLSEVWSQSYGVPKSWKSHLARFQDFHLGVPGEKNHLDVGFVANHRVYYKGEGGGFPQVRAMVSLVCSCCPWLILAPKVLQLCTNHFVWVVCRPMWVNEACQLFLVPSRNSNTPLYPSKCCELRSVPRLLLLPLFSTWTHIWVLQGVEGASQIVLKIWHSKYTFFFRFFCNQIQKVQKKTFAYHIICCKFCLKFLNLGSWKQPQHSTEKNYIPNPN